KLLSDTWDLGAIGVPDCNLSVYGPNGFLRTFKGSVPGLRNWQLDVQTQYAEQNVGITLVIKNLSTKPTKVFVLDMYSGQKVNFAIDAGKTVSDRRSLSQLFGWYDFMITVDAESSIEYHVAGHVENGKGSISDPAVGAF